MTDEYIRLDTTIIAIDNLINEAATGTMARTLFKAKDTIYNQQRYVVDAQPVKWISVNDRLPETNAIGIAHILAYDKYEGVVKADFLDKSANYSEGSNIFQISNTSTQLYKVTHWQPLPEPPKDGDTNG